MVVKYRVTLPQTNREKDEPSIFIIVSVISHGQNIHAGGERKYRARKKIITSTFGADAIVTSIPVSIRAARSTIRSAEESAFLGFHKFTIGREDGLSPSLFSLFLSPFAVAG